MKKKKTEKTKKIIISLVSIVLIFLLLLFFINDKEKNNLLFNSLKDLTADIASVNVLKKDNNINKNLTNEINKDYQNEIENLKKTLELNTLNSDKKFINATVIKRSTKYWYDIITIDKGKKDDIKIGEAVINAEGLIGKVIKVNKRTSDIKLLISSTKDSYVSASFTYDNNTYYGIIEKYDVTKNELVLKDVIGDFDINKLKNTNVVTSGLSDSFSSGLLIGKIKETNKDTYGLSYTFTLSPSSNFNNINIVSVIKGGK